jgi:hypothetical protein
VAASEAVRATRSRLLSQYDALFSDPGPTAAEPMPGASETIHAKALELIEAGRVDVTQDVTAGSWPGSARTRCSAHLAAGRAAIAPQAGTACSHVEAVKLAHDEPEAR